MLVNKKAFTLIEIIVVITIIGILTLLAFVPYNFYSNISRVKISGEIIKQALNEAFLNSNSIVDKYTKKNIDIGIFIEKGKKEIKVLSFPFDYNGAIDESSPDARILKKIKLEDGVNINSIKVGGEDLSGVIFYYQSPHGKLDIYKNSSQTGSISEIVIGYGNSVSGVLSKTIKK